MEFQFNPKVESLDSVPQDFRGLYTEVEDGGYALRSDDDGVKSAVSALTGMSRALKVARAEAQGWKGKSVDLSALSEFGDTPEAILEGFKNTLADATKGKKTQEDFQRQIEKIKADLGSSHVKEIESVQARADAYKNQLYSHLVTSTAKSALHEAGAVDPDLVLPFLAQQVKVSEESNQFAVSVVDSAGDTRYSGTTGAPMGVAELVQEMKATEKYGPLFKSEKPSGGGTQPGVGRPRSRGNGEDLSPAEKISRGLGTAFK